MCAMVSFLLPTPKQSDVRSVLGQIKIDHRLAAHVSGAAQVPADVSDGGLHRALVVAGKRKTAVPQAVASLDALVHLVFLWVWVSGAETLHQLSKRRIARHMASMKLRLVPSRQLPRRRATSLEDMDFGVFRWEEIVVSGLATNTTRRVGQIAGRHFGVDKWRRLELSTRDESGVVTRHCI